MDQGVAAGALLTMIGTLFIIELTDKDALFLLALATRTKASVVLAAGSAAFAISTAIIVGVGSVLVAVVPVFAIKLGGGAIMLAYAGLEYRRLSREDVGLDAREEKVLARGAAGAWSVFFPALLTLIALDLAGDATELVTVVFVARFGDPVLVFSGAVIGLVAAVAVETALGNTLGRLLSPRRIRHFSIVVFLLVGTTIMVTTLVGV